MVGDVGKLSGPRRSVRRQKRPRKKILAKGSQCSHLKRTAKGRTAIHPSQMAQSGVEENIVCRGGTRNRQKCHKQGEREISRDLREPCTVGGASFLLNKRSRPKSRKKTGQR